MQSPIYPFQSQHFSINTSHLHIEYSNNNWNWVICYLFIPHFMFNAFEFCSDYLLYHYNFVEQTLIFIKVSFLNFKFLLNFGTIIKSVSSIYFNFLNSIRNGLETAPESILCWMFTYKHWHYINKVINIKIGKVWIS